ncbi:MAG: hypothetical protein HOW59_37040 [Nonomuraea sp.]|nr:hypothetical protein [Nonomuraea sp.]NUQ31338.1 hypothetical protein [Dermatophilaceae bacterium]NUR81098.1 hypothetical protein [Dermatophilaceae bacterium]
MSSPLWVATDPNRTLVSSVDPLVVSRAESWRWDILTIDDAPTATLDGVSGASLNFTAGAAMRGGGSLSWAPMPGQARPDWPRIRLQPWYRLDTLVGSMEWPLGVFLPVTPTEKWTDEGVQIDVDLYDKTLVLDQDHTTQTTGVQKGSNVTDAVRSIITAAGEDKLAIIDSAETLATAIVWEPDTSRLTIVNDLLKAINYTPLWCDGYGTFRAEPAVPAAQRGVRRFFKGDGTGDGLYAPDFSQTRDLFEVPNVLKLVAKADSSAPARTSVVSNDDPASPTSTVNLGRVISRQETDVDATSQAVLDEKAAARLRELSRVSAELDVECALGPIPLDVRDVVAFTSPGAGIDVLAEVQKISIKGGTTGDSTMNITITEVLP